MSRRRGGGLHGTVGFPRVSGDEPKADAEALKQFVFSPRERG